MSRPDWPHPPVARKTSASAAESFFNKIIAAGRADRLKTVKVGGVPAKIVENSDGLDILIATPPVAATGGGSTFRGVWTSTPANPYMALDEVIVQTGAAAGDYISTIDNNANDPATGIGWLQKPMGPTVGSWT